MSTPFDIERAARILREGGLVAFPTETVYGLGADASQPAAVARIFAVKGRPADHPVIVHLPDARELARWAAEVPAAASALAQAFWPGPLTLILRKSEQVSPVVTGGQDTVGLRVPDHPVALALLRQHGGGIAAPSANRYGKVSPTAAGHVRADLGGDVDFVLDGGPCAVGIESTILDLSGSAPAILRPGGIARATIEAVLERPVLMQPGAAVRAPGSHVSHYAPRARVLVETRHSIAAAAARLLGDGKRVAYIGPADILELPAAVDRLLVAGESSAFAQGLYAALRRADAAGADAVLIVPPDGGSGLDQAILDRLQRAAGPRSRDERTQSRLGVVP
jgi:L-threonylcarbamoyladenylate synthase